MQVCSEIVSVNEGLGSRCVVLLGEDGAHVHTEEDETEGEGCQATDAVSS